jgi:hypothetical protein
MADQFVPGRQGSVAVTVGKYIPKVVNHESAWESGDRAFEIE